MNYVIAITIAGLACLAFVVLALMVIFAFGFAGFQFIRWWCGLGRCTQQWLSIQHFRRKGILDVNDHDRIATVNFLTGRGMDYEDAVHVIDDLHNYLVNDKEDPWHRDGPN